MLKDKIILLTGATDGIGKQAAFLLAGQGAVLLMHGRRPKVGEAIKQEIIDKTGNSKVHYFNADFTSFDEIKKMSAEIHNQFSHLDVLVNNAGIYENEMIILQNGIEKCFMVNHLAVFSLTLSLLDLLKKSESARIVNVSSMIHSHSIDLANLNGEVFYEGDNAYSMTKLCNILFTNKLSRELNKDKITVNSMHPGVLNTKVLKAGWGAIGNEPIEGGKRILYLVSSDEVADLSSKYFVDDRSVESAGISMDEKVQEELWDLSQVLVDKGGK